SGRYSQRFAALRARADDLDLVRIQRFAGGDELRKLRAGTAAIDVDVKADRREATGHVVARGWATLHGGNAMSVDVDLGLLGTRLVGSIDGSLDEMGRFAITTTNLSVSRGLLDAAAWKGVTGDAKVESELDLDRIAQALPTTALPLAEMK